MDRINNFTSTRRKPEDEREFDILAYYENCNEIEEEEGEDADELDDDQHVNLYVDPDEHATHEDIVNTDGGAYQSSSVEGPVNGIPSTPQ